VSNKPENGPIPSALHSLALGAGKGLDWLDGALESVCIFLLLATIAVTLTQVFFRYALNASLSWPEEMARWAFVWLVFIGMALGVHRDSHISLDLLSRKVRGPWRTALTIFRQVVVCAASIALLKHGLDMADRATYVSPALEWHFRYLYLAVPCGAALNILYLVRRRVEGMKYPLNAVLVLGLGSLLFFLVRHVNMANLTGLPPTVILMICMLLLLFLGVPVGFALAYGTIVTISPQGDLMMLTVSQNLTAGVDSFTLLAIPFFILSGGLINVSGIADRLLGFAASLVGHFRGGMAQINVINSVFMGGITASSAADCASDSKILIPQMEKRGYPRSFACANTASSAVLANLIPPSMGLILYGALASVSVGALFVATIVPGLLVAGAQMVTVFWISVRKGYGSDNPRATARERLNAFLLSLPALLLPLGIVGGVRIGIYTATEAGAVAVIYSLLIGYFLIRKMNLRDVVTSMRESLHDVAAIMFVVAAASPFAWVLVTEQVPQKIAAALGEMVSHPALLLLMINGFLIVVGLFMEMVAAMVILVPILVPIIVKAGIDPVQFGIILVMNIVMGALTPPMGVLVFTSARIAKADVADVFKAAIPFILSILAVLMLVTYVPSLSLFLPDLIGP
jgi:tripartite ATP-independent transporter DctM subunit